MDFLSTCRICLEEAETLKSLGAFYESEMNYSDMVLFCTSINIYEDEKLYPNICFMCGNCEESLLKSYDFKKRVIQANNKLTSLLINANEVKINQEFELIIIEDEKVNLDNLDLPDDKKLVDLFDSDEQKEEIVTTGKKKLLKKNACMHCNIYFTNSKEYTLHKKTNHPRIRKKYDKAKLCLICGKLASNIKIHAETHKDPAEREIYKCTICNRTFKMKDYLSKHMRTHSETNDLRYECKYCGKKFRVWATRKHHIFRYHGGESRFVCNICDKAFFKTHHFKEHMLSHSGEKPYKCDLCEKGFRNISSLKSHSVTHTKEKNHKCDVCQKYFGLRKTLMDHMKIHTGEKNYVCPVCSEAFIQNHVMRTHVTKKHPDYVLPPSGTVSSQKALKKRELINITNNLLS